MEEIELIQSVAEGLSQNRIAKKYNTSQTNVRYWLNKFDLKTKCRGGIYGSSIKFDTCQLCSKDIRNKNKHNRRLCGACITKVRRVRAKQKAIQLLGGKCSRCGWKENIAGFEFHHVRGKKSFGIGDVSHKSWPLILKELRKCELLCANCHRFIHSTRDNKKLLEEAKNYSGKELRIDY